MRKILRKPESTSLKFEIAGLYPLCRVHSGKLNKSSYKDLILSLPLPIFTKPQSNVLKGPNCLSVVIQVHEKNHFITHLILKPRVKKKTQNMLYDILGLKCLLKRSREKSTGLIKCLISREKSHVSVIHSNYRVRNPCRPALEVSSMRCPILVEKRTTLGALISDIPCLAQTVHSEITKTRHVTEDQKARGTSVGRHKY